MDPFRGFLSGSDGKESACNARDPGSIPESERFPEEGNSYPLQYSCLENLIESDITERLSAHTHGPLHRTEIFST